MPAAIKHLASLNKLNIATILARWDNDDRYYAVQVLECDKNSRKCKIRYEDGLTCWTPASDIHLQFKKSPIHICCICEDGSETELNEILVCDMCDQGYHVSCHEPKVDRHAAKPGDENVEWFCATCDKISKASLAESESASQSAKKVRRITDRRPKTPSKRSRPATPQPKNAKIKTVTKPINQESTSESDPTAMEIETKVEVNETIIEEQLDSDETSVLCDKTSVEYSPVGVEASGKDTVRDMDPELVKTAQSLLEGGIDVLKTKDFTDMVTDLPEVTIPMVKEESRPARSRKRLAKPNKDASIAA